MVLADARERMAQASFRFSSQLKNLKPIFFRNVVLFPQLPCFRDNFSAASPRLAEQLVRHYFKN